MVPPLTATSKDVSCNIRNVNLLYFSRYAYFSSVYHHSLRVISYQPTMTKEQEYLGHNLPLVIPDVVLLFVTPAICNNYCLHKGECTQPESCTCPPGYRGKRCEICKCARKEEEVRTGYVHSIPDSFRAGIKIILERVSVHTQKRCGGAISVTERSCAAPILNVERYISNGFCAILWCSVNTYSTEVNK